MKRIFLTSAAVLALTGLAAQAQMIFTPGEDDRFNWASLEEFKASHTGLEGQSFKILGPWLGGDKDLFESIIPYFQEATGVRVEYSGSDSFEQQIIIDAEGGALPDMAVLPQPGLAAGLAAKGQLKPLPQDMRDWIVDNYASGEVWADMATYAGPDGQDHLYAFPYKADMKSLVWYVPENFEDMGYEPPETLEDLRSLTEQIAADGEKPWCIGLGSGGATGWPATDWVEDLMLRINTPEDYDNWISNELPFNDPKVVEAIDAFGWFAKNPDFVAGGVASVSATDFRDSPKGLFGSPPDCYMHRQASFIPTFFPDGAVIGEDADFFYFPAPADGSLGQPVLGGGTMFALMRDNPAALAFIEFLQTPIAHEIWMAQTGFVTPHKGVNSDVYGDETARRMSDLLLNADTFRFDASDLMPAAIGTGFFWTGMMDFVGGKSAQQTADAIQATWDTLK